MMHFPKLLQKKACYVPTRVSLLVGGGAFIVLILLFIASVYPFLACSCPLQADACIVEGWLSDYCLEEIASRLSDKSYVSVYVTGGPLESGSFLKEYKSYAELGAATLRKLGVPDSIITAVPAPYARVNRTYDAAVAFKNWIDTARCPHHQFNLYSQATHTRRSHILYKRALGRSFEIGALALQSRGYDPRFWWRTSEGVRTVIDESVAYLYALLFMMTIK